MTKQTTDIKEGITGQPLLLIFEQASDGGYLWSARGNRQAIFITKATRAANDQSVGNASLAEFSVVAHRPGNYVVEFEYKRPWESQPEEIRTITFNIK